MFSLGPSNTSGMVGIAFLTVVGLSVLFLMIVTFFMIYFLIKYNKKKHPHAQVMGESVLLEVIWTVIPTLLVLALFYFGWKDFEYIRNPPKEAMTVNVIARQWTWQFDYQNGVQSDLLRVPIGKPVKLLMTSKDVIHSFFVPAFRVKEDCVPGLKTHLWFTVNDEGSYDIFCTEYCGVGHSHMRSKVVAMGEGEFSRWYEEAAASMGEMHKGRKLLSEKGCLGCHTVDGTPKVGPTLKGVFGHEVTVTENGKEKHIIADEAYLQKSILQPGFDVVKGYQPIMPAIPLSKKELHEIIDYIEKIK